MTDLQISEMVSNIATTIASAVAVCALLIAWIQLRTGRLSQREATAKEIYREYLQLALEYPQYSLPDYPTLANDQQGSSFKAYEWFVSFLLYAGEEILELFPKDEAWRITIGDQLKYHRDYLEQHFEERYYGERLRQYVAKVLEEKQPCLRVESSTSSVPAARERSV